jgi:hypothetical protein
LEALTKPPFEHSEEPESSFPLSFFISKT